MGETRPFKIETIFMKMFITWAEILFLIKSSFGPGSSNFLSLAVLSSLTFSVSVVTQIIYKSHSIAKFQGGVIILVCLIIWPCALNLWRRWWAIDFQVPERPFFVFCKNRAQSLYLVTVFPSSVHKFFYPPISLLFYGRFHVFLTIAICIYLCFAREVLFRFLAFSFINHTTRTSNITSFLCKRLVVKKIISKQSLLLYKTEMFCVGHSKPEDLTSK